MIQANEIRVGNLLYSTLKESIISVNSDIIRGYELGYYAKGDNEPIPISEDWLFKFGFGMNEKNWHSLKLMGGEISYNIASGSVHFTDLRGDEARLCKHVKYIHQLQNLCHALSDAELPVKEDT